MDRLKRSSVIAAQRVPSFQRGPVFTSQNTSTPPLSKKQVPITRVVLSQDPANQDPAQLLQAALHHWPLGMKTQFLLFPGGFVTAPWPKTATFPRGWESAPQDIKHLLPTAQKALQNVLTPKILKKLQSRTDYISLGIDLTTPRKMKGPHAELVALVETATGQVKQWTGKSYPLPVQEKNLFHITDLKTHQAHIGKERVLILGCHDLNAFSPRTFANQSPNSPRRQRTEAFLELLQRFKPTIILQHPHGTDTPNIWRMAWQHLQKKLPSLKAWASGIAYFNFLGGPKRAPLEKVLQATANDPESVFNLVLPASPR